MDASSSAVVASLSPETVSAIHDTLFVVFTGLGLLLFTAGFKLSEGWLKR